MAPIQWLLGFGILALTCPFTEAQTTAYNPGECDKDNGQYHVDTKDGQTWKIACNMQNGGTELSRTGRPNLASCIDLCSWTQGCNSVDYTPSTRVCIFYAAGTAGTTATPGTHNVYRQADPSKTQPSGSASPAPSSDAPSGSSPAPSNPPSGGSTSPSGTAPTPSTAPAQGGPSPPAPAQLTIVSNPTCPGDDGKGFVADDGTHYKIQCGYHAEGNEVGKYSGITSFSECLKKCSETNGCISVQYMNSPPAPGYIENECVLSDGEGPGTRTCAHWFAYTVPPPATENDDPFPYTLCETVCPFSDGLIYESENGENFRMSCGKRHGTKILWTQPAETFDDCMDICGKVIPCHSVDYQARTKKCYLGTHHGQPTLLAPGFASATSIGCAGACKKSCSCSSK